MEMSNVGNSFLVQHFTDTVWMIHPEKLKTMTELLLKKVMDDGSLALLQANKPEGEKTDVVQRKGSTAILNIEGVMVPKASWLDAMCGFTSTIGLHHEFNGLVEDPSVDRIINYFDTPGGSTTGIEEFAQSVFEARKVKEVISFTDVDMCSAGFYVGSAAEHIVATPSSDVGSVGVYASIIKEKTEGRDFDVHIFQAGANKLFGSPETPLTEAEKEYFQAKVDGAYETMTADIAKYMNASQEQVKETEASFYSASAAPDWMNIILGNAYSILK